MNESNPTLRTAKKLLRRIAKKLGNKDSRIVVQMSTDSDHPDDYIVYAAMISSPKEGVRDITFAGRTKKEFIDNIKSFLENKADETQLEITYWEGKKIAAQNTIEYSDSMIEKLKNPKTEDESEPVEDEIVQEDTN